MPDKVELDMVIYPQKALKQKASAVSEETSKDKFFRQCVGAMIRNMYKYAGIGLAGQQVGLPFAVFILDTEWPTHGHKKPRVFLNPTIEEFGGGIVALNPPGEGCLSTPYGYRAQVSRAEKLRISWNDLNTFERREEWLEGVNAIAAQHECLWGRTKVITENGSRIISDLVKEKFSGKVLSVNPKTMEITYKKVIGWRRVPNKEKKKWILLKTGKVAKNNNLICTEDHLCAVYKDILQPEAGFEYLSAASTLNRYMVTLPNQKRVKNKIAPYFSSEQLAIIIGTVLGDGHISKAGELSFIHGNKQLKYADYKAEIIGNMRYYTTTAGYTNSLKHQYNSQVNDQLKKLRELIFPEGKRTIKNILHLIDEKSLAIWWQDDGSLNKNYGTLHTEGLSLEDNRQLIDFLKAKWNLTARLKLRKSGLPYLSFGVVDTQRLLTLITKYIHPSMRYKTNLDFNFEPIKCSTLELSGRKITTIKESKVESALFDLTVEDNHNLFANNNLVHNCDHLFGLLFVDRLSHLKQDIFKRKARKVRRQYTQGVKKVKRAMELKARTEKRLNKAKQRAQDRIDAQQAKLSKKEWNNEN